MDSTTTVFWCCRDLRWNHIQYGSFWSVWEPVKEEHDANFVKTTTFKGKPLTKRFKRGRRKNIPREWFEYLAIAPASDHPLLEDLPRLYRTLDFENCTATDAPAYVKVSEVYSMDWRDAQLLWRGNAAQQQPARLDAASLATLLYAVNVGGRYIVEEQYDPTAVLPQLARQPTATSSTLAAGKRIATSSPAEGDPLSLVIPPVGSPIPDRPVAAKTTSTVRTHPPVGRSHPGRTLVNEQQPLLPSYHRNQAPGDSSPEKGFFGWLWAYLKKTRLAIIIRAVCFCDWS